MSFSRSLNSVGSPNSDQTRHLAVHEEKRRALENRQIGVGTLACARCDAPVSVGPGAHAPTVSLTCPFCAHRAPLRDFLSLAAPARPARVIVRLAGRRG